MPAVCKPAGRWRVAAASTRSPRAGRLAAIPTCALDRRWRNTLRYSALRAVSERALAGI